MREHVQVREAVQVAQAGHVPWVELDPALHVAGGDGLERHPGQRRERRTHHADRLVEHRLSVPRVAHRLGISRVAAALNEAVTCWPTAS